ncbi:hypothetical protein OHA77_35575 [Streptosporangium sp. NBC_01639]|uniref:hypothetical protein n=1 Tax=Streptosporangium sp. NBC_01639 TaxID=2975948 RepID=UPI00386DB7EB|nr:hypothetical protein OHA77_35575 [Streptosporangium sp. NBC_01639]
MDDLNLYDRGGSERDERVLVDPELPEDIVDLFHRHGRMLSRIRAGWRPEPRPASLRLPILQICAALAALFLASFLLRDFGSNFFIVAVLVVLVVLMGRQISSGPPETEEGDDETDPDLYRHAHWYEDRYLLAEDFDHASTRLLDRTGQAVDSILRSEVNAAGMLDDVRNSVMLPAQEWEIARLLAKLSALRAEHREAAYGGSSPEVAAAMAPLDRALAASETAVVARVEALERYARHVAAAERALRAHDQIELLRARLPRYEELLAESGADALAVPELDHLSEDAGRLEQALRDSVRSAHEAFRYLDGPSSG